MSRKPERRRPEFAKTNAVRTEWVEVEVEAKRVEPLTIPTKPQDLKPGNEFQLTAHSLCRVVGVDMRGITVSVVIDADGYALPSAFFSEDLAKRFPGGIPVLWEPKVITGEMEMTALNVPLGLTVGTVSSTLREVLAGEGALPGERYRVTFEQLPGVE